MSDKFCSKCGNNLNEGDSFCSKCGHALDAKLEKPKDNDTMQPIPKQLKKPITPPANKKPKGCLIALLVIVGFLGLVTICTVKFLPESAKNNSFEHDESLDNMNIEGEKGYRVKANDLALVLYMKSDGTVNMIRYADHDLYAKGKVVSKIGDYTFTISEMSDLQTRCQNSIKGILKAPSTAKFPNINEWKFSKQDGIIIVQGYVDSQNSFGASLRSDFQFKIKDNTVTSLIFDGTEYINGTEYIK